MTFIALTCDNCGQYGDIICQDCKKRGLREYCYCGNCIEEHLEGDEEERDAQQEWEEDKQFRRGATRMKHYEITYTRTQTVSVKKSFASLEDAKRYADDPRASDGSCLLDGSWDEIEDTYDIEEAKGADEA